MGSISPPEFRRTTRRKHVDSRWNIWLRNDKITLKGTGREDPFLYRCLYNNELFTVRLFFFPMPPHVLCGLRSPPSWAWQEWLLRLGRPRDAVTLSRWCVWVVIEEDVVPAGTLNLNSTNLPRPWQPLQGKFPRKGGNRTRDLMISSQRLWPLDNEAGHC